MKNARFSTLFSGVRANLTELLESPIWEQITDINALLGGFLPLWAAQLAAYEQSPFWS